MRSEGELGIGLVRLARLARITFGVPKSEMPQGVEHLLCLRVVGAAAYRSQRCRKALPAAGPVTTGQPLLHP